MIAPISRLIGIAIAKVNNTVSSGLSRRVTSALLGEL